MAEEIYPMPSFPTLIVKAGNVREVTVTDPDRYTSVFMVPINLNLAFDDVIERIHR